MMVNSQRKGKDFERRTAKMLTLLTGHKWHRVPCSGAMSTSQNLVDPVFDGDVFCEHPTYKGIVVECKTVKRMNINALFSINNLLWKWIGKLEKYEYYILIFKIDGRGIYALSKYPGLLNDLTCEKDNELLINGKYWLVKINAK